MRKNDKQEIRLPDAEKAEWRAAAEAVGSNVSEYVRGVMRDHLAMLSRPAVSAAVATAQAVPETHGVCEHGLSLVRWCPLCK